MSLILDESRGLEAKTGSPCSCHREGVWITGKDGQDVCISNHDFSELVKYFLTNMPLPESGPDVRIPLVEWVKGLTVVRDHQHWMRFEHKSSKM